MNLIVKTKVVIFNILNRDLVDFSVFSNGNSDHIFVPSATVERLLLPPQQSYSICFQSDYA